MSSPAISSLIIGYDERNAQEKGVKLLTDIIASYRKVIESQYGKQVVCYLELYSDGSGRLRHEDRDGPRFSDLSEARTLLVTLNGYGDIDNQIEYHRKQIRDLHKKKGQINV